MEKICGNLMAVSHNESDVHNKIEMTLCFVTIHYLLLPVVVYRIDVGIVSIYSNIYQFLLLFRLVVVSWRRLLAVYKTGRFFIHRNNSLFTDEISI